MKIITVTNLERHFEGKKIAFRKCSPPKIALSNISFEINEGEIWGLLGPNGAGKTTTIKIMSTLLAPTHGTVKIMGFDSFNQAKKIRPHINVINGSERGLYWRLSGYDNLSYFCDLYNIPQKNQNSLISSLLELVGLSDRGADRVETYSKGMKQKLQIAKGLINDPKILFMDEPTIGLDPISAQSLRRLILELKKQGKTIILTTHYMQEAYELCDTIAIIKDGKIIAHSEPNSIIDLEQTESIVLLETTHKSAKVIESLFNDNKLFYKSKFDNFSINYEIRSENPMELIKLIVDNSKVLDIINLSTKKRTLEDAYISLLNEEGH